VLKIDDPLDAFAVHGACGFWGVFATGLFGDPVYTKGVYGWAPASGAGDEYVGAFFGGSKVIGANFTALVIEVVWVAFWSTLMFLGLKFAGLLRVPLDVEAAGMDISKHGGVAYTTDYGAAPLPPKTASAPPTPPPEVASTA